MLKRLKYFNSATESYEFRLFCFLMAKAIYQKASCRCLSVPRGTCYNFRFKNLNLKFVMSVNIDLSGLDLLCMTFGVLQHEYGKT